MGNPWFRLYAEILQDHKVQMMSEAYRWRLVALMCIRCNVTETLQDDQIAFHLRVTLEEWHQTKQVFLSKNFIDEDNNLTNWDKRQFVSDSSAARVRKHREAKKEEVKRLCNVTVTPPDTETDTETDTDIKSKDDIDPNGSIFAVTENSDSQQTSKKIEKSNCPYEKILQLYHEILPEGVPVKAFNNRRKTVIKARWSESKNHQALEFWQTFFQQVANSKFLTGKVAGRDRAPFVLTLDKILRPEMFAKIIDGFYNRDQHGKPINNLFD